MNLNNIKIDLLQILDFVLSAFSLSEFKRFHHDNRGGLVLSFDDIKFPDKDWVEYKHLKVDKSVKSVNPDDLPGEFCDKACKLVDEFHRKTVNENVEWMLYFDYTTGDVIYCWKGEGGKTGGLYDKLHFQERHIASIHNHPKKFYSFPSLDNFEIFENDFEDYEIICSYDPFWIIESKGILGCEIREKIKLDFYKKFQEVNDYVISNFEEETWGMLIEDIFSEYLLNYLNDNFENININKRYCS